MGHIWRKWRQWIYVVARYLIYPLKISMTLHRPRKSAVWRINDRFCWKSFTENEVESSTHVLNSLFCTPVKPISQLLFDYDTTTIRIRRKINMVIFACVELEAGTRDNRSTPLMEKLHWLPIEWRVVNQVQTRHTHTPVARHTLQTSYGVTQPQSPRVHLHLSCFLFHVINYHLLHGLSTSLPLKFGIPYLFTLGNHNHSAHSDAI